MSYDTKELCKIWRELIFCFKNDKTLVNFDLSNKKSKNCSLWSLLSKVFWPKKVQRSIFHDTEDSCEIWRKTDLCFGKWHEEFGKFSSQKLKMTKLVFSWDPFAQSRKCMSYKLTKELKVMTLMNDEKSEEDLACHFKIDIRNLTNIDWRTRKSQKLHLNGLLLTELCNVWAKKVQSRVMFDCTQDWYKVSRKTSLCFQKLTWGIWQFFTRALESLQIETLIAYFCLKLKMYELKIYSRVKCHENEEWCKNWKGIDLSVQNWHGKFDKFWPEHSKISKIRILRGKFALCT